MKKRVKKLVLAKETVRSLNDREVLTEAVVGGITEPTCQRPCFATESQGIGC